MSNSTFFISITIGHGGSKGSSRAGSPFWQRIKPCAASLNCAKCMTWLPDIRNGNALQQKRNWRIANPRPTLVTRPLLSEPVTAQTGPVTQEVTCPACRSSAKRKTKDYLAPAYEFRSTQHPDPAPLGRSKPLGFQRSDFRRAAVRFNSQNWHDPGSAGHDCRVSEVAKDFDSSAHCPRYVRPSRFGGHEYRYR